MCFTFEKVQLAAPCTHPVPWLATVDSRLRAASVGQFNSFNCLPRNWRSLDNGRRRHLQCIIFSLCQPAMEVQCSCTDAQSAYFYYLGLLSFSLLRALCQHGAVEYEENPVSLHLPGIDTQVEEWCWWAWHFAYHRIHPTIANSPLPPNVTAPS